MLRLARSLERMLAVEEHARPERRDDDLLRLRHPFDRP
jgi:hypothetical protein